MKKHILDGAMLGAVSLLAAAPAFAGEVAAPVPLAGVGLGAFVVLGIGYRALRNRIDR